MIPGAKENYYTVCDQFELGPTVYMHDVPMKAVQSTDTPLSISTAATIKRSALHSTRTFNYGLNNSSRLKGCSSSRSQ